MTVFVAVSKYPKFVENHGLMRWAESENFKRVGSIWCGLSELDLIVDSVRSKKIHELEEQVALNKNALKDTEDEIKNLNKIMRQAEIYQNNMIFHNTVNTSGGRYREQYEKEHKEELKMFESAKKWLENNGVDPSSLNIQEISFRYNELSAIKDSLKDAYILSNKEYKDLVNMDKSMREFFNPPKQPLPIKVKEHHTGR